MISISLSPIECVRSSRTYPEDTIGMTCGVLFPLCIGSLYFHSHSYSTCPLLDGRELLEVLPSSHEHRSGHALGYVEQLKKLTEERASMWATYVEMSRLASVENGDLEQ